MIKKRATNKRKAIAKKATPSKRTPAAKKKKSTNKKPSRKELDEGRIWVDASWVVKSGKLVPGRGKPTGGKSLFSHVAEKIPFEALDAVRKHYLEHDHTKDGVYVAHDSMGYARYAGRGDVFARLKARYKAAQLELKYFSFYIVASKKHEREVETLMIRLGGPHLHFNARKKRVDIQAGNIQDYEPGTRFIERQKPKGKAKRK
jgi:hypothetical protein